MPRARPAFAWVGLAALLLSGCGGRSHEETTTTPVLPPEASRPSLVDVNTDDTPAAFDWSRRLGVAGHVGSRLIAAIDDSLDEGAPVTLVWLGEPQRTTTAHVARQRSKAWTIADTPVPGRAYDLEADARGTGEGFAVAITGRIPGPAVEGNLVRIDLDGDGHTETFRQCSSLEGMHFTVWSGEPLKGPQDWHRYVYLGTDLEVTCTGLDTGE